MELLEKLIEYVGITIEKEGAFGPMHTKSIVATTILTLLLCFGFHSVSEFGYRVLIGLMSLVMIAGEVIKQVAYCLSIVDGEIIFQYDWRAFPFQLCSTPLYIMPLVVLLPRCKFRDALIAYTMTFSLIGGLAVYATPDTALNTSYFGSVQSMVHHGLQITAGIYTAVYYRSRIKKHFFVGAVIIFAIMVGIATIMNTIGYDHLIEYGKLVEGDKFNMFYISPRADQTVPVQSDYLKSLPPEQFIIGYFLLLSAIGGAILGIVVLIDKIARLISGNLEKENDLVLDECVLN